MSDEIKYARNRKVLNKTAAYTLTRQDSGALIHNLGATGSVTITLPVDPEVDDHYTFVVAVAQGFVVDPNGTSQLLIVGGAEQAGGALITADDEAETVSVTYVGANKWLVSGTVGTWTVT